MNRRLGHILLTGATGRLGSRIVSSGIFPPLLTPGRRELDLTSTRSVRNYLKAHPLKAVIHTAAIARMKDCQEHPADALQTNLMGTCRLVDALLRGGQKRKPVRFIHLSTDGVYPGTRGRYKETDPVIPYNHYGWTKLGAECPVHLLKDYCIIRTRFYDPAHIPFDTQASDAYTSSLPVDRLVEAVHFLLTADFVGTVNVGGKRLSDYTRFKKIKPSTVPCRLEDIRKKSPCAVSGDASMDCRLWDSINPGPR